MTTLLLGGRRGGRYRPDKIILEAEILKRIDHTIYSHTWSQNALFNNIKNNLCTNYIHRPIDQCLCPLRRLRL
jgi:hypothetical protein